MDTLVGKETEFVFNTEVNREPVKCPQDWCDVFMFLHPHQDPFSTVLDLLELRGSSFFLTQCVYLIFTNAHIVRKDTQLFWLPSWC